MSTSKIINGKKFTLSSMSYTKKDAIQMQKHFKKLGRKTRLITSSTGRFKSGELMPKYRVYTRK